MSSSSGSSDDSSSPPRRVQPNPSRGGLRGGRGGRGRGRGRGRGGGRGGASGGFARTGGPPPRKGERAGDTEMKFVALSALEGSPPDPDEEDEDEEAEDGEGGKATGRDRKRWLETKTIKGKTYLVDDEELFMPHDEKGDQKIDANGVLLGGRELKMPTFTSRDRSNPNKHYMLAIDAARSAGFRDSLYFFRRNPLILKVPGTEAEKEALINAGCLHVNLRSRGVTICSVRNAYRALGARFIKDGRHVVDDYYEDEAVAAGKTPGELAGDGLWKGPDALLHPADLVDAPPSRGDSQPPPIAVEPTLTVGGIQPIDDLPPLVNPVNAFRTSLAARLPNFLPPGRTVFGGDGRPPYGEKGWDPAEKKRKPAANLTPTNWLSEYARATAETNRHVRAIRRDRREEVDLGFEEDVEGEEWEDVELDVAIDDKGRVIRSDDEGESSGSEDGKRLPGEDEIEEDEGEDEEEEEEGEEGEETTAQQTPADGEASETADVVQIFGIEKSRGALLDVPPTAAAAALREEMGYSPSPFAGAGAGVGVAGTGLGGEAYDDQVGFLGAGMSKATRKRLASRWTTTVKERRLVEKTSPIGLFDPYTGGAMVRKDGQPTRAWTVQLASEPRIDFEKAVTKRDKSEVDGPENGVEKGEEEGGEAEEEGQETEAGAANRVKRRKLGALRAGIATVDVVLQDLALPPRPLLPGMWDFGAPRRD